MRLVVIRWLKRHPVPTFCVTGLSFFLFGLSSLNLVQIMKANVDLIAENGLMALQDGAARQALELLISGYLSVAFWLVFKTGEKILVDRLTEDRNQ